MKEKKKSQKLKYISSPIPEFNNNHRQLIEVLHYPRFRLYFPKRFKIPNIIFDQSHVKAGIPPHRLNLLWFSGLSFEGKEGKKLRTTRLGKNKL